VGLAVLAMLVMPSVTRANCGSVGPPAPLAPNAGVTSAGFCPFEAQPLEQMVNQFNREAAAKQRLRRREQERKRRERAAKRRAKLRAAAEREAKYVSSSQVDAPNVAPTAVVDAIEAANSIATTPYVWGGGHGSFESSGYDCSGAVSYALHGAGFLESPLDSTGLETWGESGPGRWITVYASADHAWMVIDGIAFDTVGGPGPRWHDPWVDSPEGFVVRHPTGY
jgi:hypothetical protein